MTVESLGNLRMVVNHLQKTEDAFSILSGEVGEILPPISLNLLDSLDSRITERRTASGAAPRHRFRELGLTLHTPVKARSRLFVIDDTIPLGDLFVHVLITDMRVGRKHRRVLMPRRPVFDFLVAEPLAHPTTDGAVPEVMGIDLVRVDVGVTREVFEYFPDTRVTEGTVSVLVEPFFVPERVFGLRGRMDVEPVRDIPRRPGQRTRAGCPLKTVFDVVVECDLRDSALKVNVANAQRRDSRDTQTRVKQDREECFVAGVVDGVHQRLEVILLKQVVGRDGGVGVSLRIDIVDPVFVNMLVELPGGDLVVPDRGVGQSTVGFDVGEEVAEPVVIEADERIIRRLHHNPEGDEVVVQSGSRLVAVETLVTEVTEDGVDVLIGELGGVVVVVFAPEFSAFAFELGSYATDIVQVRAHEIEVRLMNYKSNPENSRQRLSGSQSIASFSGINGGASA